MFRSRPLLLVGSALLIGAVAFALVADDRGAAAVGVLGIAAALLIAGAATSSGPWHVRGPADDTTEGRERVIERSRGLITERLHQAPHPSALAPLTIAGLDRVRGREAARLTNDPVGAFDAADGRLVLVGEPGAGKSTVLSQLCQALLDRTDGDPDAPIPVLLSLTTWKEPQRRRRRRRRHRANDPFTTWFVEQSALTLGISDREARTLMPSLVPVLDGLDEVASDQRRAVAIAIEQAALRAARQKLVVACREREFAALTAPGADALPAYRLEPLSREDLIRFFTALDPEHWQPVVDAIADPASPLGPALSTPLMLTVSITAWGTSDPASQIPSADDTVEHVRAQLWDRWVDRAARQAGNDTFMLAVGLARAADLSGRTEIRFEELGDAGTRRAWWISKTAVAVTLTATLSVVVAASPLFLGLLSATSIAFTRIVGSRLYNRSPRLEARLRGATETALLLAGAAFPIATVLLFPLGTVTLIVICLTIATGAFVAWANPLPDRPWLHRWQPDPFVRARVRTHVLVGFVALLAIVQISHGLDTSFGLALLMFVLNQPVTDDAAHHWIARGWYRFLSQGGPLRQQVTELVDAGFLRPTSDAWRFFHLELQNHLANRPGPGSPHRLEHRDQAELFTAIAISRIDRREFDAVETALRNAIVAAPGSALELHNYAHFLTRHRQDRDRAGQFYRRALAIDPNRVLSLVAYADLLERTGGDPKQIEDLYERALSGRTRRGDVLYRYATFLHRQGGPPKHTNEVYRRAVEVSPDHSDLLSAYALFLDVVLDDREAAKTYHERAIGAVPQATSALWRYAVFLRSDPGQHGRADELHRLAIASAPEDTAALFSYGRFRLNFQRDHAGSLVLFDRAQRSDPENAEIAADYAMALDDVGQEPARAQQMHLQAIDAEATANRLGNYARHCAGTRQWPAMVRYSRQALEMVGPGEEPLELECYFYLWAGGDPDARGQVQEILDASVRSPGWRLDMVVDAARVDGHADIEALAEAARQIAEPTTPSSSNRGASPAAST